MSWLKKLRNVVLDVRYGGRVLGGNISTKQADAGSYDTVNSDYDALEFIFSKKCALNNNDVLVDVGCGKGRVLNFWLMKYPTHKIYGVELDPEVAAWTAARLRKYKNVQIIDGSIIERAPSDATVFYLFNPFVGAVMDVFKQSIAGRFKGKPIRLVYYHPSHLDVFLKDSRFEVDCFDIPHVKRASQCALITNRCP